ncbi:phytoene/squalene synthase family protein [Rivibacter subsaxonicus]|uniref:Phytoene synthase n=1 Tax=Rivibacter subsaxonicus TaxID=457575 RepID=A0A4V6MER4_9BURK|nr:phytoene/squalene synthase family protein [Rivibacter subsaxonicus]RZU02846.1 phytoene synthase [Rivibacter subsaxonicus]
MQTSLLPARPSFAPEGAAPAPPERRLHAADVAACRELLEHNSRTFHAASLLLPRAVREPASVLYGFCRLADDAVDVEGGAMAAIALLRERLACACAGQPLDAPADRALAVVIARHAIPRALPEALIEGLEWDAQGRRYETIEALHDYAARVAGAVGAMMALLMGVRSPAALARACDLGVAMQLSNIARDVGEDARMGRVYLPLQWLREAGIEPDAWLARPVFDAALASVVKRVLNEAERLYARVDAGVAALPLGCRPGINAARFLYAEIGHEVERQGLNSVDRRAVVPVARKARLLLRALVVLAPDARAANAPVLAANRFLVDAVSEMASLPSAADATTPPWWHLGARAVWMIELFDRLERLERQPPLRASA